MSATTFLNWLPANSLSRQWISGYHLRPASIFFPLNSGATRYYVSRDLHHSGDACSAEGWRLPAREIEPLVRTRIVRLLNDPLELLARAASNLPAPGELNLVAERGKEVASALAGPRAQAARQLRNLVDEIRLGREQVGIQFNPAELEMLLGVQIARVPIKVDVAGRLKRSGHVMRLLQRDGSAATATVDRTLVKAIVQARTWWRELQANNALTVEDLAQREGLTAASLKARSPRI